MAGAQLRFSTFDGSKKSDWFWVDFDGCFNLWMMLMILGVLAVVVLGGGVAATGINLGVTTKGFVETKVNIIQWCLGIFAALNALIAFCIVWVWRWNPTVVGPRRQFRYICSWL